VNLLAAVQLVLNHEGRALNAKQLSHLIQARNLASLRGATPWKTIGARLAVDIRSNPSTPFLRIGRGLYGLRDWPDACDFQVPPRKINPLDEDILVVERPDFVELLNHSKRSFLYDIDYRSVLLRSLVRNRTEAEATEDWVQIIPSFVVFRGTEILSFKRTKKTPEKRLHDRHSVVFGGHLQAEDQPGLFLDTSEHAEAFLFRELHEELSFSPGYRRSHYVGVLYLQETAFERQHAGVVFAIDLEPGTVARSMEPGYHSSLEFMQWDKIDQSPVMHDRWSEVCIKQISAGG